MPWHAFQGGSIDIHKAIGKLPKPKAGFTFPGHKYTGPYNPLEQQLKYDPITGEILEIYDQPTGPTMQLQSSMMLIIVFIKIIKNTKIKLIEKWFKP